MKMTQLLTFRSLGFSAEYKLILQSLQQKRVKYALGAVETEEGPPTDPKRSSSVSEGRDI